MTDTSANLAFLPWVRQGAAASIQAVDTLQPQKAVASLGVTVSVNGSLAVPVAVRLRGPADVVGLDVRQVVRMDPPPASQDFEPNCFPCVEFDRPDFPWLFTPARADANGRLRPWLCLVVVREQTGVSLGPGAQGSLPVLQIAAPARPGDELPDLAESWAWAHGQAAAADNATATVGQALAGNPALSLSRLLCPRRLEADTAYTACVVPAFELGRRSGLGITVTDADLGGAAALAAAWSMTPAAPLQVTLPVYHHWRFQTGPGGDFESLARQMRPRPVPAGFGLRPIDISQPGFSVAADLPPGTNLLLEGALQAIGAADATPPWPAGIQASFQSALTQIVNAPGASAAADPAADPLLAPTLYGHWHAARATVSAATPTWLDQLNLDPRYRAIAAVGTQVVQQAQEALMAAAWAQAADLRQVNRKVRQLQMSLAVGKSLHTRHLSRLDPDATLRVTAPAFGRIRTATASDPVVRTMVSRLATTPLPVAALSVAMRRIGRERGPLTRRVATQGVKRAGGATWIDKINRGGAIFIRLPLATLATVESVRQRLPSGTVLATAASVSAASVNAMSGRPSFQVVAEGQAVPVPPIQNLGANFDDPTAYALRTAAAQHLARINPTRFVILLPVLPPAAVPDLNAAILQALQPRTTVARLAQALVSTGPNAVAPSGTPASAAVGLDAVMAAPRFTQPMSVPMAELSQDLLLPGIENVLPDSVLGLATNRRFIDAYMVGLNVEMAHELLWRGYPTDQRGTCFAQFWDSSGAAAPRADIAPLSQWADRALGSAQGAPSREQFVMLMRSSLLRRYPDAMIYAAPALMANGTRTPDLTPANEVQPAFRGDLPPDLSFFGFDIGTAAATGQPGYYIVIQEHPTAPRFGLDVGVAQGSGTHLEISAGAPPGVATGSLTWGLDAAHMAGIVRRLPVRIAIHAASFIAP